MDKSVESLSFGPAHNEFSHGYNRQYTADGYAGKVVFGFVGDIDERTYFLSIDRVSHESTSSAVVQGDTSVDLVELMNDDEMLGWIVGTAGYTEIPRQLAA